MSHPVSIGDDGRGPGAPDDGPLLAALKAWFAEMRDTTARQLEQHRYELRQARAASQPVYAPVKGSGTIDANGNLVIDLGGPQIGRQWGVGVVIFSDAGSFWTSMGSALGAICIGNKLPGNTVNPDSVRWPFSSGPNAANFSSGQVTIIPRDHLLISVTSGAAGQNIQATAWIQDYDPMTVRATAEV